MSAPARPRLLAGGAGEEANSARPSGQVVEQPSSLQRRSVRSANSRARRSDPNSVTRHSGGVIKGWPVRVRPSKSQRSAGREMLGRCGPLCGPR
jgi:hypothetical protein